MRISHPEVLKLTIIKSDLKAVHSMLSPLIAETINRNWNISECELTKKVFGKVFEADSFQNQVRCVLWNPSNCDSNTTAFINNMPDGWPTITNKYFKIFGRDIIRVVLTQGEHFYPINMYEQLAPGNTRCVMVQKEEKGWKFFESGNVLPFENLAAYKRRAIKDRLDPALIKNYLFNNGIDISKEGFWRSMGTSYCLHTN